ncbi:class I SAM-dependent methyltransferase [Accumulibacter sp.]|uniref:class I SAM-dependent methyltransferase n=1 Tax=Accumulibacter sp. TaxID=2053492 RepID=UPI002636929E|nr:class I SAM-dependent methyltransferase [Accumulibacter sp.]
MADRPTQVNADSYRRRYMSLPRMITHWHQASEVAEATRPGGKVLEIGPGAGHTTWLMRQWGLDVTTLDFDESVKPDIIGDVTAIPCKDKAYDCVLAAEVLEHIPFPEFAKALAELGRICRGTVIVTLPAPFVGGSALLNFSGLNARGFFLGLPYWIAHKFDGQHYWELGKRGYGIRRIRRVIQEQGFRIAKEFRPAPSLFCYFFVLSATGTDDGR